MFLQRVLGVFRLNVMTFEEIEHDEGAIGQAVIIVTVVALCAALGTGFLASFRDVSFLTGFIVAIVWTYIGWFLWALSTYLVGKIAFKGQATLPEMLRVIGFAYTPLILSIFPLIGSLAGGIWALAAGFIAVRQGLDLDDIKAAVTILGGFLLYVIGWWLLASFFGLAI
jgi:hypothetical protein